MAQGFVPSDPLYPFSTCLGFDKAASVVTPYSQVEFRSRLVSNRAELLSSVGVDFSASARYLNGSGAASLSYLTSSALRQDSLTFAISIRKVGSTEIVGGAKLNKVGQDLIADSVRFKRECGSHYVNSVTYGASATALITFIGVEAERATSIRTSVHGEYRSGAVDGSVTAALTSLLQSSDSYVSRDVSVVTTGGDGGKLKDLISLNSNPATAASGIEAALKSWLDSVSNNPSVVSFSVASMGAFGYKGVDLWGDERERILQQLVDDYFELSADIADAKRIDDDETYFRRRLMTQRQIRDLPSQLTTWQDGLNAIAKAHRTCLDSGVCSRATFIPTKQRRVFLPAVPRAPRIELRVEDNGALWSDEKSRLITQVRADNNLPLGPRIAKINGGVNGNGRIVVLATGTGLRTASYSYGAGQPGPVAAAEADTAEFRHEFQGTNFDALAFLAETCRTSRRLNQGNGSYGVNLYFVVRDFLGREFSTVVASANAGPGQLDCNVAISLDSEATVTRHISAAK